MARAKPRAIDHDGPCLGGNCDSDTNRDKTARGHRLAVRVASSILRQQSAILQNVALADLQKALQVFRDYSDHLFSFVDCTSFAVMERLGINHAFAFDSHFDEYSGIIRVPC